MARKKFIDIFRRQRKSAGFTLVELLVTVMVGWIVISGLIYFVVQLLRSDRQEFARTETEREMSIALNYISSELKEAVYIYEGECLGTTPPAGRGVNNVDYCPGLKSVIASTQPATLTPILAFWKLETLPYVEDAAGADALPDVADCNGDTNCQALLITRNSYTLVVYSLDTSNSNTWEGPARIVRYQLRQYSNLSERTPTTGYCAPSDATFTSWPRDNAGDPLCSNGNPVYNNEQVLVDLVDDTTKQDTCPSMDYSKSPPTSNNLGFFACVRRPLDLTTGNPQLQDAIIYVQGNAVKRAGASLYSSSSFYPRVQAQVKTRSTLTRTPPQLE